MFRKCSVFVIVFLLSLLTTATAAFAAPAGPDMGGIATELLPVAVPVGLNWTAILTTVLGAAVLGLLVGWARKQNFDDVYPNVIFMAMLYAGGFGTIIGLLLWAGVGSIILQLTSIVATAMFGYAMCYGKRAGPFKGRVAPLSFPALATFLLGLVVIIAGLRVGLDPFVASQKAAALAAAQDLASGAGGAASNAVLLVLTPLFVFAASVIQKFATRDADAEETVTP